MMTRNYRDSLFIVLSVFVLVWGYRFFFPSQATLNNDLIASILEVQGEDDKSPVMALIEAGADINYAQVRANGVISPLVVAVATNQNDLVQALIKRGAEVNLVLSEKNALDVACEYEYESIVDTLLASGAIRHSSTTSENLPSTLVNKCQ